MAQIEIKNIKKSFGAYTALHDINLTIEENQFVCFIGPSGCGKTTLLRIVAGLEAPTSGAATIDGEPIVGPSPERGMVFQEYSLFPWRTILDNTVFGLELKGIDGARTVAARSWARFFTSTRRASTSVTVPKALVRKRITCSRLRMVRSSSSAVPVGPT